MSGLVASMPTLSIAEEEYQQQVQHHSENTKRYVQKLKEVGEKNEDVLGVVGGWV